MVNTLSVPNYYPGAISVKEVMGMEKAGYDTARARVMDAREDEKYGLGQKQRNTLMNAGRMVGAGNLKGARSALYASGNFEGGAKLDAMLRQQSDDALAKQKRQGEVIGNLAIWADTPEKWAAAVQAAKRKGLDTSGFADFTSRDRVIAENGMTKTMLDQETARRKAEQDKWMSGNKNGMFNATTQQWSMPPGQAGGAGDPNAAMAPELRKKLAEQDAKRVGEYAEGSEAGVNLAGDVNKLRALRSGTGGFAGSWFDNAVTRTIGRNVGGFGGIVPTKAQTRALDETNAGAGELTLSSSSKLKGVLSDSDMKLIARTIPDSDMTDEAAANVMSGMEAGALRAQDKAAMYDVWLQSHGTGRGFQRAWARFANENPLFKGIDANGNLVMNKASGDWSSYVGAAPGGQPAQARQPGDFRSSIRPAPRPDFQAAPSGGAGARSMSSDDLWAIANGQ